MCKKLVRMLLAQQLITNPLPWRVNLDWNYEVVAANGTVIVRCPSEDEAQTIIELAEGIQTNLDSVDLDGSFSDA